MSQRFVKGLTNNHLTWVMVDATDFATPESALSAATKIKIYGKLRSGTGTNFVSSGTGSLTNDITHVGASALGIYTIALAKADLSDASAAWYDQYIISLSATGAAYQTLVVDGGIIESYLSAALSDALSAAVALSDQVSNVQSYLVVMSGMLSDTHSAISDAHSDLRSYLTGMSGMLSDTHSAALATGATASAIADKVWSDYGSKVGYSASQVYSVLLVDASRLSDLMSYVVAMSGMLSDTHSAAAATGATASAIADKVWSDYSSKVGYSASQVYSVLLVDASRLSDLMSYVVAMSGMLSDTHSAAAATGATASAIADKVWSDYGSKVGYSASQVYSVLLVDASRLSDLMSYVVAMSGMLSDTHSAAAAAAAGASPSAVADKVWSDYGSKVGHSASQVYSVLLVDASRLSDLMSYVVAMSGMLSDTHSAAILAASYASNAHVAADLTQSRLSDFNSAMVNDISNIVSALTVMDSRVILTQSHASNAHSAAVLAQSYASEAQSLAALLTTAHAEPTGVPAANATPLNKIGYMFAALRNKVTVTATKMQFFDDADAALWEKDLSDDTVTYTETEGNLP